MHRSTSLARQIFRHKKITRHIIVSRSLSCEKASAYQLNKNVSLLSRKFLGLTASATIQTSNYSSDVPSHIKVNLPALSPTMEKGSLVRWLKSVGDRLDEGDLLAEIETDKATMGFETPEEGYLAAVFYPAGSKDIDIGKLLCIVVENESDIAAFKDYKPDAAVSAPSPAGKIVLEMPAAKETTTSSAKIYPDHLAVNLPALSPTMETGSLHGWQKSVGDRLEEGDVLVQIETDKATMDFETPDEGYLAKVLIPAGQKNIPIGTLLCVIVAEKEDVAAFADFTGEIKTPESSAAAVAAPTPASSAAQVSNPASAAPVVPVSPTTPGGRVIASPLARRTAIDRDIDLKLVHGTGPGGRVTVDDVMSFTPATRPTTMAPSSTPLAPAPTPVVNAGSTGDYEDIPTTNIRQVIAKRLLQSKTTIPHYYLSIDVDTSSLLKLRGELNKILEADKVKLSVNDFIVKASALSCKKIPEANSSWQDTYIRQHKNVDINVAVATDAGLITPIIFGADERGLTSINSEVGRLAAKAREGTLQPQEFMGGTFTISNLGMFGIKNFSAIINPPQACILAIGGTQIKLVADEDMPNGFKETSVMAVTLSCDHRVVDGAVGALWLKKFKSYLENPKTMLL